MIYKRSEQTEINSIRISQVPRAHYLRRNGRFSVTGERMGAIVHDAFVIVADAIIGNGAVVVFVEVMLLTCKQDFSSDKQTIQDLSIRD